MTEGEITYYRPDLGYGFITYEDKKIFFHKNDCYPHPKRGDKVLFALYESNKHKPNKTIRYEAKEVTLRTRRQY